MVKLIICPHCGKEIIMYRRGELLVLKSLNIEKKRFKDLQIETGLSSTGLDKTLKELLKNNIIIKIDGGFYTKKV